MNLKQKKKEFCLEKYDFRLCLISVIRKWLAWIKISPIFGFNFFLIIFRKYINVDQWLTQIIIQSNFENFQNPLKTNSIQFLLQQLFLICFILCTKLLPGNNKANAKFKKGLFTSSFLLFLFKNSFSILDF